MNGGCQINSSVKPSTTKQNHVIAEQYSRLNNLVLQLAAYFPGEIFLIIDGVGTQQKQKKVKQ